MRSSRFAKPGVMTGAIIAIAAAALFSCSSTSYSDGGGDTTGIGPGDVVKIADHMSGSIHGFISSAAPRRLRLERKIFSNRTSGHIDTGMIADAIEENLVRKGVTFLETRAGDVSGSPSQVAREKNVMPDANLLHLTGEIREMMQMEGQRRVVQYTISMKLVNSLSAKVEWTDSIRIEKRSRSGSMRF